MASTYEGGAHDLRIVLLGVSGVGKSSIGNAILGREAFKESRTRESEIQRRRVEDRNISIIDTPGFFNTQLTDEEMKKQMMKSLYLSDPGPHVFLLVINLENFKEDKRNIVEQIQENFGEEAFLFTMVLFIGREKFSRREFNQIIENHETKNSLLNYFEGRFDVINSKSECDPNQIEKLLKSIDEMVKNNRELIYSNEIYLKTQRKHREQEDRIKEEVKEMQKERDTQKQKREINPKVDIKTKSIEDRMKEEVKEMQKERDTQKQKREINPKVDIKTKSIEDRMKEEVKEMQKERDTQKQKREINPKVDIKTKSIEDRMKEEVKEIQIEKDTQKQKREINPKVDIKTKSIEDRMKEEVKEMQKERGTQKQKRKINPKVDIKTKSMEDRMKEDNERKQEAATDMKIVLLGKTGSGKSSTGNTILGRNAFRVSFVSSSQTCEKQEALVSGRSISITDTPGLLDVRWYKHFQHGLKRDIEEMSAPGPYVFLLVIRPNGRYTDEERNTMRWIQENFGEEAVRHTFVLFTHVDLLICESLDQYIRKSPDLQLVINSCGGRFHSFNNLDKNNQNQVTELLEKIEKCLEAQIKLKEQREKQQHTRPYFPVSTSPQEKREEERRINQDREIQSKEERNKGDNERNQEPTKTEKDIHELRKETDQLFRLVMNHEMDFTDLRWSLNRVMKHNNLSRQNLFPNLHTIHPK